MPHHYDRTLPWNVGVEGDQVLAFINDDFAVFRMQAGAGTGKTFGLRKRVLRIRHPDGLNVAHQRVLVCAFNRVIARDLEREIREELDPWGLPLPTIMTVHALCAQLLRGEPLRVLLPHETDEMLYDVLTAHPALRENYTYPSAGRALREHEAQFRDHTALMQAARGWLAEHGAVLIGDVPRRAESALRAGDLRDRYDHVLVDEWQDLTTTEARVIVGLRAEGASLAAIGDRKQSIYAFRGNHLGGLDALGDFVGEVITEGTMDECRRCPSEIVALGNAVVALEGEPLRPTREGGQIHRVRWRTPVDEAQGMAHEIVRVYRARPTAKHLVLVTRHDWGYALRDQMRTADATVPVQTLFAEDVLHTWPATEAFIFLSILGDPRDAVTLRDWVAYREDEAGTGFRASARNADAYLSLKLDGGVLTLDRALALADREPRTFHGTGRGNVHQRLRRLRDLVRGVPLDRAPKNLIATYLDPERWIDYDGGDAGLAREDILRLRTEGERFLTERPDASLGDVVRQLRYRIATREPIGIADLAGVRIVTLWGAKGLTADHVYLVGLCDEALPGPHDEESTGLTPQEHLDEQRRLLFVSLTRARDSLVLSRPSRISRGVVKTLRLLEHGRNPWWQDLSETRFFEDVSRDTLPDAVPGDGWAGNRLLGE